jgi:hypothetical protein
MPPGGIGWILGRPLEVGVGGSELAVEDGYGIVCDMGYGWWKDDGGSIDPGCAVVGDMCEKALALLPGIDALDGVCGAAGDCD